MAHGLVMALDIGNVTGIAEGPPGPVRPILYSKKFILDNDSSIDGYGRAVAFMALRLREIEPLVIFVEGIVPEFKLFGQTTSESSMNRIGLYGALCGVASAKGIPVIAASIARVRTNILGHGHKLKGEQAKKRVKRECEMRGWGPKNNHESDAAAVWLWGCGQVLKGILDQRLPL